MIGEQALFFSKLMKLTLLFNQHWFKMSCYKEIAIAYT
jgi:hypothetical protein